MNQQPKTKKHLGQHLLRDPHTVQRILGLLDLKDGDHLLEIGPGLGALTIPLMQSRIPLTVVEADGDMVAFLEEQGISREIIIEADFLDLNIATLIRRETKIVSNLPYNASVPITARLLEAARLIPRMVLMYQKEVAERIRARHDTKDYGPISVLCQLLFDVSVEIKVPPQAFRPAPKVQSRVLLFRRKQDWLINPRNIPRLHQLLRFAFQTRRKMMGTILKKGSTPQPWSRNQLATGFKACGLDPRCRPENLALDAFVAWFQATDNRQLSTGN